MSQNANVLKGRLDSLNDLVRRRGSLVQIDLDHGSQPDLNIKFDDTKNSQARKDHSKATTENSSVSLRKLGCPHCLCERSASLAITDASRRLSLRLEVDSEESPDKISSNSKVSHQSSSRSLLAGGERSKQSIQKIVKQLQSNSTKYLSRSANSIQFRVNDQVSKVNSEPNFNYGTPKIVEDFPIPIGGVEMHPDLLIKLACGMMKMDGGKGLLRTLCLDQISLNLFVYMFWFIHCRFFQKPSGSEQRYLLGKISGIFPSFIELLTSLAPPHQRDLLLRHFPFVLSKAIHVGFRYLCPGNQSLFKGPFMCILNLSVFRLLTGVDICPQSVDSLRLKLYPDDVIKDESGADEGHAGHEKRKIRPLPSDEVLISNNSFRRVDSLKRKRAHTIPTSPKHSKEISLNESHRGTDEKSYPRHQQVNFDVNQISPLLQQCLGRDCVSLQPKRFIKRIEPIQSRISGSTQIAQNKSNLTEKTYLEELMQQQSELKRNLKAALDENHNQHHRVRLAIARGRSEALKTQESTEKMARSIMQKLVVNHKVCQKVLS